MSFYDYLKKDLEALRETEVEMAKLTLPSSLEHYKLEHEPIAACSYCGKVQALRGMIYAGKNRYCNEACATADKAPQPDDFFEAVPTHNYMCEIDDCPNKADVEWVFTDQEGDFFYTFRCNQHPKGQPFIEREIR